MPRSLTGIIANLFKPHKPDTCQILLRRGSALHSVIAHYFSGCRLLLVSEIVQYLISPYTITLLSMKVLLTKEFVS